MTGQFEGLEVEIVKFVAQAIFGIKELDDAFHRVAFEEVAPQDRQRRISERSIDIVVTASVIDESSETALDWAGPYFMGGQAIAVRIEDSVTKSAADLNGKKVCAVRDAGSDHGLRAAAPQAAVTVLPTPPECATAVKGGRVAALVADLSILVGLANDNPGSFRLVHGDFAQESYGIAHKTGDRPFRDFLNRRLEQVFQSGEWAAAFDRTLGKSGLARPAPPTIRR